MGTSATPTVNLPCKICTEKFDVRTDSEEYKRDPFICVDCLPLPSYQEKIDAFFESLY